MPKRSIIADRMNDPEVAQALRVHVAERSELLQNLTASLQADERIRAAWLWGSFLRGEQDDLSDLDVWLLVPDDAAGLAAALSEYCCAAGTVLASGENPNNGPEGGGYLGVLLTGSHGLHHLDIYWQPASKGEIPDAPLLFNRLDLPCPPFELKPVLEAPPEEPPLGGCRGRIAFLWLMLSVAAKYLARDPSSDMALLLYPKPSFDETVTILGMKDQVGEVKWTSGDDPFSKVNLLRKLAAKSALLEQVCRDQGLDLPAQANPCLVRYFALVEGILRAFPA